jgi:hypothetical protein
VARRLPEQGRWGGPDAWTPTGSERERERERKRAGARGPAWGKEKWAGPEETVEFFIYSNKFQTSSNCFDQKGPTKLQKFQIKYVFEGNQIRNKISL